MRTTGNRRKDYNNMGAESSTSITSLNQVTNDMIQGCKKNNDSNQRTYFPGGIKIFKCDNFFVNVQNSVKANFKCDQAATFKAMQSSVGTADVTTTAGLWGIAVSDTQMTATNLIKNFVSQSCTGADNINQTIQFENIDCQESNNATVNLFNNYTSSFTCALAAAVDTNQKTEQAATVKTTTWDPVNGLVQALIACAGILLIGGIVVAGLKIAANKKDGARAPALPKSIELTPVTSFPTPTATPVKV